MKRTISRPSTLAAPQGRDGGDAGGLEPDVAGGLPRVDVGAVGDAGHVELDGAEVGDGARGDEAELVARRHGRVAGAPFHLVAPHVGARHARHARVGLVVLGLPHRLPVRGLGLAVDDQAREVVCVVCPAGPLVNNNGWL